MTGFTASTRLMFAMFSASARQFGGAMRKQQAREQFNMRGSFGIVNQQDKGWNGYEY